MGGLASIIRSIEKYQERIEIDMRKEQRNRIYDEAVKKNKGPNKMDPEMSISFFKFDKTTRECKFECMKTQQYRTILRYVTRDYVKQPIYSEWKTKITKYKKHLVLSDENLEKLPFHYDDIIAKCASLIVGQIEDTTYWPSWYVKDSIANNIIDYKFEFNILLKIFKDKSKNWLDILKDFNDKLIANSTSNKYQLDNIELSINKQLKKLNRIKQIQSSKILDIMTFGIYHGSFVKKKYEKILKFCNDKQTNRTKHLRVIEDIEIAKDINSKMINSIKSSIEKIEDLKNDYFTNLDKEEDRLLKRVKPLTNKIPNAHKLNLNSEKDIDFIYYFIDKNKDDNYTIYSLEYIEYLMELCDLIKDHKDVNDTFMKLERLHKKITNQTIDYWVENFAIDYPEETNLFSLFEFSIDSIVKFEILQFFPFIYEENITDKFLSKTEVLEWIEKNIKKYLKTHYNDLDIIVIKTIVKLTEINSGELNKEIEWALIKNEHQKGKS